jgi:tetratricopeptide (TPR) repeat protein
MNDTVKIRGLGYCKKCAEKIAEDWSVEKQQKEIKFEPDPTVCGFCGMDGVRREFERIAQIPACDNCVDKLRHRPFPAWIKITAAAILVLSVLLFIRNLRFFQGYMEFNKAVAFIEEGDVINASEYARMAREHVPENDEIRGTADFLEGLKLASEDRSAEALECFERCREVIPREYEDGLNGIIMRTKSAIAFDCGDYDGFLKLEMIMLAKNPDDAYSHAGVASAFACKYAVSGDEEFRKRSLEYLKTGEGIAGPDDENFKEYKGRIMYRLDSRKIISKKEYDEKFGKKAD